MALTPQPTSITQEEMADDPDYLLVKTILGQQLSQESLIMAPGEELVAVAG